MEVISGLKNQTVPIRQTHSNTPRESSIENYDPVLSFKQKLSPFVSPNRIPNSTSFLSSHTRTGSSFMSPPMKVSFIDSRENPKKLEETLSRISEGFSQRDTNENFNLKNSLQERAKSFPSTERSTLAKQLSEDNEFSLIPTLRWCAYCSKETSTEVEYRNSRKTFWSSVGIFFMGGFLGCFLIPYMMDGCKDTRLICHTCKREIS